MPSAKGIAGLLRPGQRFVFNIALPFTAWTPFYEDDVKCNVRVVSVTGGWYLAAGMWDVVTAAHAICKGRTQPIDIVSMLQPPSQRYFAFLSLNFGLVSNLDIGTEHLR